MARERWSSLPSESNLWEAHLKPYENVLLLDPNDAAVCNHQGFCALEAQAQRGKPLACILKARECLRVCYSPASHRCKETPSSAEVSPSHGLNRTLSAGCLRTCAWTRSRMQKPQWHRLSPSLPRSRQKKPWMPLNEPSLRSDPYPPTMRIRGSVLVKLKPYAEALGPAEACHSSSLLPMRRAVWSPLRSRKLSAIQMPCLVYERLLQCSAPA